MNHEVPCTRTTTVVCALILSIAACSAMPLGKQASAPKVAESGSPAGILRNNGSYPSGHTAAGWTWALVLAEVDPAHAGAIIERGRSFGESWLVCNVHWQSDVLEGRFMAASVVSQLHTVAEFREDIENARHELAAARAKALTPNRDCASQAEALKQKIAGVL